MNKTEILNIVNEPTKHIQMVKIDGKDSIVYSAKFVELLELIPTMLTKADMVDILDKIRADIESMDFDFGDYYDNTNEIREMVCKTIDKYKAERW